MEKLKKGENEFPQMKQPMYYNNDEFIASQLQMNNKDYFMY